MIAIDLGSGPRPRDGYIGIDIVAGPGVTHVLDFITDPLPLEDASVDAVFSSHCFEHVEHPKLLLNEILRVCKPGAQVELWMPYGHSDDAFILGHHIFYTELHWRHFVLDYPQDWLPNAPRHYVWDRVRYNLAAGGRDRVKAFNVTLPVAIKSLVNVAWEFGLFFTVADGPPRGQAPVISEFAEGRYADPIRGAEVTG